MTEPDPPSLQDIEARLRAAGHGSRTENANERQALPPTSKDAGMGLAFRIGTELVAALAVGVGGGFLLDRWLGTAPWGLICLFLLGAAAGVLNVYRATVDMGKAPNGDANDNRG